MAHLISKRNLVHVSTPIYWEIRKVSVTVTFSTGFLRRLYVSFEYKKAEKKKKKKKELKREKRQRRRKNKELGHNGIKTTLKCRDKPNSNRRLNEWTLWEKQ